MEKRQRAAALQDADAQFGLNQVFSTQNGQRGYLAACAMMEMVLKTFANLRGGFLKPKLKGLPTN